MEDSELSTKEASSTGLIFPNLQTLATLYEKENVLLKEKATYYWCRDVNLKFNYNVNIFSWEVHGYLSKTVSVCMTYNSS